jgi:hypothetical protein
MAGFGTSPFGTSPFGFGSVDEVAEPTANPFGSRFLDPATRDYRFDSSTGQLGQMPPLRQRVLLTLLTERDSSAVAGFGTQLPKKIDRTFVESVKQMVRVALRYLTDTERVMRIDSIDVRTGGWRAEITVSYTDLETGIRDEVKSR